MITNTTPKPRPAEDDIRDYAYHLYLQHGCIYGHEKDDWLEAEACLSACIPKDSSRTRLHRHTNGGEQSPTARMAKAAAA